VTCAHRRDALAVGALALALCGATGCDRLLGLQTLADAARSEDATGPRSDGARGQRDATASGIEHTPQAFAQEEAAASFDEVESTVTFNAQAAAAGDLITLLVGCVNEAATGVTSDSVTATSSHLWTWNPDGELTTSPSMFVWGASFHAFAPDTDQATVTVSFGGDCETIVAVGDEFGPGDDVLSVDTPADGGGGSDCNQVLTDQHADGAIWGAVVSMQGAVFAGSGYTVGAVISSSVVGMSEYELGQFPTTTENVGFISGECVIAATAIAGP
jgi:hypothetical protein